MYNNFKQKIINIYYALSNLVYYEIIPIIPNTLICV